MIAVDPKVIPLGSIVHIPGYGEGWATDTGGAIKGRRIDVCHASRSWCNRFGRRKVEITIIGYKSPFKSKKK
jgi:3D (Asp-Asp-Asp) domain-containing protein